jgi:hypothetical protein
MTPVQDESLLGALKRLAKEQSFSNFEDFQGACQFVYGRPFVENLEEHAKRLGLDPVPLRSIAPSADPVDPALSWPFHRMHRDPICPACIEEGRPRRKEWRHALVSACADHGVRLIDACGACRAELSLGWGSYDVCACGTPFGRNPSEPATEIERLVAQYVAGTPIEIANEVIDAEIDPDAIATLWFLASGCRDPYTGKYGKSPVPKTVAEAAAFMTPVSELLLGWPDGFDTYVRDRWDRGDPDGITASQRLGPWYRSLKAQRGSLAATLFERCVAVLARDLGDAYKVHGRGAASADWLTAKEASRLLGLRAERLVDAVANGSVDGHLRRSVSGHRHTVIARACVDRVASLREHYVDKVTARSRLGVSRKQFELLEEAGVVNGAAEAASHPCIDGAYDSDEMRGLLSRLRAAIRPQTGEDVDVLEFRDINLRRTTDRSALLELYRSIGNLSIPPVSCPEDGCLGDMLFDHAVVSDFLKQHGAAREWTAVEVAQFSGWKPECVSHWCHLGILEATRSRRGSFETWQVSEKALARFNREYAVVSDLAKLAATSSRSLLSRLVALGIETHGAMPTGASARGHLVRKVDLLSALVAMG